MMSKKLTHWIALRRRHLAAVLVAVCVCLGVMLLGAKARDVMFLKASSRAEGSAITTAARTSSVQMLRFTVDGVRLYPEEVRISKGLVTVTVRDLMSASVELSVWKENGQKEAKTDRLTRSEHRWRGNDVYNLTPGRYQVFDERYPHFKATLIVTAQ